VLAESAHLQQATGLQQFFRWLIEGEQEIHPFADGARSAVRAVYRSRRVWSTIDGSLP
jgi:hypothetical protein